MPPPIFRFFTCQNTLFARHMLFDKCLRYFSQGLFLSAQLLIAVATTAMVNTWTAGVEENTAKNGTEAAEFPLVMFENRNCKSLRGQK